MIKGCIAVSLGLLLLTGCRSHPEIPVSDAQSLVMESTVLAAGVTAEPFVGNAIWQRQLSGGA